MRARAIKKFYCPKCGKAFEVIAVFHEGEGKIIMNVKHWEEPKEVELR